MIQAVAANAANSKRYLIAAGSTSMTPRICIWEKKVSTAVPYAMISSYIRSIAAN